ncbi:hypothetical protein HJFPF1_12332 [Paramyrothecium foliicola]|nr:hypothetical protein HJFPF1_12332 [Paramyrothecium foliicola]
MCSPPDDSFMFAYDASQFEFNYGTPVLPDFGSPSARPGEQSQTPLRGGQGSLPLLQLSDWNADFQDDDVNPTCIHYDIEWKLQLRKNKKSTTLAEITEENLTLAPGAYWEKYLCLALAKMVEAKLPGAKYEPYETTITVSTTKRGEKKLKLQGDGLHIDWQPVENKIRAWGPFFEDGNKLRIDICFVYREIVQPTDVITQHNGRGATGRQLNARDRLLAQQEEESGTRPVWKEVYALFHCTGVPCTNNQFYCWRDPESKKHYKLDTNILDKLVDHAEEGKVLRTHNDVPEDIRQLIYKHAEETGERKDLKRKRSGSLPPINISITCPGHHQNHTSGDRVVNDETGSEGTIVAQTYRAKLVIPLSRDKALTEYYQWQCSKVDSPTWKAGFWEPYQITRKECLDLRHVYSTNDVEFYTKQGVKLGIALSFVGDIRDWAQETFNA